MTFEADRSSPCRHLVTCRRAVAGAVLSAFIGFGDCAQAQVITGFSSTPASYSSAGQKIVFKIEFNSGNFVVESVNVASQIGVSYSCSGWAAGQTNQKGSCSGIYVTKASDLPNTIEESPTVKLMALGNIPHELVYQGGNPVIRVAMGPSGQSPPGRAPAAACDPGKAQTCISLVQDTIPWRYSNTQDPASRHWSTQDLVALCRCTGDAPKTVLCFQNALYNNGHPQTQSQAIAACRAQ
jgi:hypothetical protein